MSCEFCDIISGKLPCTKVYEDEDSLVIMDIATDVDGHMVAFPKKHCFNILDCGEESLHRLISAVKRVSEQCVETGGYTGVNLLNASGISAGQSVYHLHFHIVPREEGDGVDGWPHYAGARHSIRENHERIMKGKQNGI